MLHAITDNIWEEIQDLVMPGRIHFSCRMTVIRLGDGSLLLHSPVRRNEELAEALAKLGPVRHLVAPNCLHHLFLKEWADAYPEARVYAAPGLEKKRKDLRIDEELGGQAPAAWREEMEQCFIGGTPWLSEIVFFHRPSKTLIVTDLVFHIHDTKGLVTHMVMRMAGVWRRLTQSRMIRLFVKDRAAAGASVRNMLHWDFERVIMAHGEIVEKDARKVMPQALAWMLG